MTLYSRHRLEAAHKAWFVIQYPQAYSDGHYAPPKPQAINSANTLTNYIVKFLTYSGHRATRINVSGRLIDSPQKQASGITLMTKRYMRSQTRKGTADISATIHGRSVMLEIKWGRDKPSEHQLAEQARERAAGGVYEFIHSVEEFLQFYDTFTG